MQKDKDQLIKLIVLNIKQCFSNIIVKVKRVHTWFIDWLKQRLYDKDAPYRDFAPTADIKEAEEYLKSLNWAIKNKNVKNIALTGPFGSGKSSIIKAYIRKHPSTKALNISLATFDFGTYEPNNNNYETEIEHSILRQLFYKVKSNKIPQSRYRKLKKKSYIKYLSVYIMGILISFLGISFFVPQYMKNALNYIVEIGTINKCSPLTSYIVSTIFLFIICCVLSYITKWISSNFRIREIRIANQSISTENKEKDSSVFNHFMDELVYFFEETKCNVVFFEDLDRFSGIEIFIKLRELNTILNNYDLIRKKIVFIYAIKDDIFNSNTDRTKFFDFIIPVIPIINSTNSGEILRERLKFEKQPDGTVKSSLYDITPEYINLISPFIEDMRILTSICNEFAIYKNTLSNITLIDEEMFSLMIFKNLYPKEFEELEFETGIVKEAFDNKSTYVKNKQDAIRKQIKEDENLLNKIDNEILFNIEDIKAALLYYLAKKHPPFNYCNINGRTYSYTEILNDSFDMSIFNKCDEITVFGQNSNSERINPKDDERFVEYLERIENIQKSKKIQKEELRSRIEGHNKSIMELHTYSLKKLIEIYGYQDVLSEDVVSNELLVFLIRKGLINENYNDYINYFHPNSITKDEMKYVRGIRILQSSCDFSYAIKNTEEVCNRIDSYEFKQPEALNFDIADYLISKIPSDLRCKEFFAGFANGDARHDDFIRLYIDRKKNINGFINGLCKYYKDFWYITQNNDAYTIENKNYYLYLILEYADIDDILNLNNYSDSKCISHFIEEHENSLAALSNASEQKIIEVIEALDIVFVKILPDGANERVLRYIFDENKYVLNMDMLQCLFTVFYPEKLQKLSLQNYTVIRSTEYEPLIAKIHDDFESYVTDFVIGQETNKYESIDSVEDIVELLSPDNAELGRKVIDMADVTWDDITNCCVVPETDNEYCREIWDYVLATNKVERTWDNYAKYHGKYNLTNVLVDWVDQHADIILKSDRAPLSDNLVKELISDSISIETFDKIIQKYSVNDFELASFEFDEDRLLKLIDYGWLQFSLETLEYLKTNKPQVVVPYIIKNKEIFLKNIETIKIDIGSVALLLSKDEMNESEKQKCLSLFAAEDMTEQMAMNIRDFKCTISKSYTNAAWNLLSIDKKYQLLLNQLDVFTINEISDKFKELDNMYQKLSDTTRRHKEYLAVTDYNNELLSKLLKKDYITSYNIENDYEEDIITHEKIHRKHYSIWIKKRIAHEVR